MTDFTLYDQLLELKQVEAEIKAKRFEIEQKIADAHHYNMDCGKSKTFERDNYEINFTVRTNRKVNYVKLKELQQSCNIPQEEIERVFRFKPEVNMAEYKTLNANNKQIFDSVIEKSFGKPSLKITLKEQDNG
jgi:hypothetical protein